MAEFTPSVNLVPGFNSGPIQYASTYGLGGLPVALEVQQAPVSGPPADGSQTRRQDIVIPLGGMGGTGDGVYGGLPGFPAAPLPCLSTWRRMMCNPTIALAYAVLAGQVASARRSFEVRLPPGKTRTPGPRVGDGVISDPLDARAEFVSRSLEPILDEWVVQSLWSVPFGFQPFEQVWGRIEGRQAIVRAKDLLQEATTIQVYPDGEFAGLLNLGAELGQFKGFSVGYDVRAGNYYGRSRLENLREEWWQKLNTKGQGHRVGQKASGIQPIVRFPDGPYIDELGNPTTGYQVAVNILNGLKRGTGAVMRNMASAIDEDDLRNGNFKQLLDASLWAVDEYNSGDQGPALGALLEWCKYLDAELFYGFLRPPREAMEGQNAGLGQSDSGAHGQVGVTDSELIHTQLCRQLSRGPINDLLVLNWGVGAKDSVYLKGHPQQDDQERADEEMIKAVMSNKALAGEVWKEFDIPAAFERRGFQKRPQPLASAPGEDEGEGGEAGGKGGAGEGKPGKGGKKTAADRE